MFGFVMFWYYFGDSKKNIYAAVKKYICGNKHQYITTKDVVFYYNLSKRCLCLKSEKITSNSNSNKLT